MKKRICVITGTRADYGILSPVMRAINRSPKLQLLVVATGMHLMRDFGYTIKEIQKDGIKISEKVDISYSEDSGRAMADSVGKAVSKFSKAFSKLKPDIIIVLGDRGEMLAAAIAGNYLNIPVAHIHGGEISGHVDGILRHAITKLSHIHFPATKGAKKRILKLGEELWRVHTVGAPAIDRIMNEKLPGKQELIKKYSINTALPLILLAQHPVITESKDAAKQIKATLDALKGIKAQTVIIYPNADAGGRAMIKMIKKYVKNSGMKAYKSIPHKDYLGLMSMADVLVGNSSSGIIEAASFRLPAINTGTRQENRERSGNVIDVPYEKKAIARAVKRAVYDKKFRAKIRKCRNIYGDGRASERIVKVLNSIKDFSRLLGKKIVY